MKAPATPSPQEFERLGAFYLGRVYDAERQTAGEELLLYDAKDLTTHAICVGMTGSGKTGLCVSLLEEAAIDGIPAIAIDPKGDLANLALTFPKLRAQDFEPWIDASEAAREGVSPSAYAGQVAKKWKQGLAGWGQDGERIQRFRDAAEVALYTPGSRSGRPLRVLRSLDAPSAELLQDADALRDRIEAVTAGLLGLLGEDTDPIRSRPHILIANLLDRAWTAGRNLSLGDLIGQIQRPPFERLGVMDLESFFPEKERFELSLRLNNLLASPGFSAWMEGEPLDIGRLLWTEDGRPRISVLSIAHLGEAERMFFVSQLLNEVLSWVRSQPGTSSLRALLYMDEIFGYFPPLANPPSKKPMLTLLKQARAYGLGVVLATQNPVDLDYKGLGNTGTWFLGRLQTQRDKERVLDGLEGAAGAGFNRAELDPLLSGLGSRVFLMSNVHDDRPELFQTRWALSYLRGPMTRSQINTLTRAPVVAAAPAARETRPKGREKLQGEKSERPVLPPEVPEGFLLRTRPAPDGARLLYRPALLGSARLHFVDRKSQLDRWDSIDLLAPLGSRIPADPWKDAEELDQVATLEAEFREDASFEPLASAAMRATSFRSWKKRLVSSLYQGQRVRLLHSPGLKRYSDPNASEGEFRALLEHAARERRDLAIGKLRKRYAPKLARLEDRIRRAQAKVDREREQHRHQKLQTVVSLGATVLGALFGRKTASVGTVGRAATTLGRASRTSRERADVTRAAEQLEDLRIELESLAAEFDADTAQVRAELDPRELRIEERLVRPRKSDIEIDTVVLAWVPWWVSPEGVAERAF